MFMLRLLVHVSDQKITSDLRCVGLQPVATLHTQSSHMVMPRSIVSAARFLSTHLRGRPLGGSVLDLTSERSRINHVASVSRGEENVDRERNRPLLCRQTRGQTACNPHNTRKSVRQIYRTRNSTTRKLQCAGKRCVPLIAGEAEAMRMVGGTRTRCSEARRGEVREALALCGGHAQRVKLVIEIVITLHVAIIVGVHARDELVDEL